MTWFFKTLTTVLLVASSITVVEGVNACLESRCLAGSGVLILSVCGITDTDLDDVATCFDTVGRSTIGSLFMPANQLTKLPSDLFTGMSNLILLQLAANDITNVDVATFRPIASTVRTLFLHQNALTTLSSGLFAGMEAMEYLTLGENPLTTLPTGIFDDLTSTSRLHLHNLQLTTLPSGLFANMGSLQYLRMEDGMLSALDVDSFEGLVSMEWMDLRNNALTTLPAGVFEPLGDGTSLRLLRLGGNADLQCIPTSFSTGERSSWTQSSTDTFSDPGDYDGLCECTDVATCGEGLVCSPGAVGYTCDGCHEDGDCNTDAGEVCCLSKLICEVPDAGDPGACGDPHMTGFRGQKFDFTGEDGAWYAVVSDLPHVHLNMRVTAPVPSLPEITYITGISIITTDADDLYHTIVISVSNPHSMESVCSLEMPSCLAEGALHVVANGEEIMLTPGEVTLAPGVAIAAVNLPGECRSFGFEKYWEQKKLQLPQHGRRLTEVDLMQDMSDWVLADPTATNMMECEEYVAKAVDGAGMFEYQSEHASFQIMTPTATIRLSHGRLHQLPMRDPTDQYDLPDHLAWQMNLAIDHNDISFGATGILGETLVPTVDQTGVPIMQGMDAIRGDQEDYRVSGPLDVFFSQGQNHDE